jgi:hypothetical protein
MAEVTTAVGTAAGLEAVGMVALLSGAEWYFLAAGTVVYTGE